MNSPLRGFGGKWVVTRNFESKTKQMSPYFRYLLDSEYSTFKYKQINMTEVSLLIIYKNKQRLVVVIRKEYLMVPPPYFAHVQEEVNNITPSLTNPCQYLYSLVVVVVVVKPFSTFLLELWKYFNDIFSKWWQRDKEQLN